jgi:hypothetical protein
MHQQHKLLHLIGLVALEARSGRGRGLDDPILDADAGTDLATSAAPALHTGSCRFGGVVHTAGFDVRAALQSLQPRDLLTQPGNSSLEFGHFAQQPGNQVLQLGGCQNVEGFRMAHA